MKDKKNFDDWNQKKKQIEEKPKKINRIKEGNIYWVTIGVNIGREIHNNKKPFNRPVLVVKNFEDQGIFWGVPLTSKHKDSKYFFRFKDKKNKIQYASLVHFKSFDCKRVENFLSKINKDDFREIRKKLSDFIINTPT